MTDKWLKSWNDRYSEKEFAYGVDPNEFLKEQMDQLSSGKVLFGAEGEGRNAVYAAKLAWKVSAFDISMEGRNKAMELARENQVSIDYRVGQLPELNFEENDFDVLVLIYAHFPPAIRSEYHQILGQKVKKGGMILLEGFGKKHLEYRKKNP